MEDVPWVHLDTAGTRKTDWGPVALQEEYLPKGPTGGGVRLLIQVLRDWNQAAWASTRPSSRSD